MNAAASIIPALPAAAPSPLRTHLALILAFAFATGAEAFTTSAVGLALPRIAADFAASPDEISWAVTAYLAAFTVCLPLTAWRAELLGQRRYLALSIVVYLAASLGCMLSPTLPFFLAMRGLEGAAGSAFLARAIFTFTKEFRPPVLFQALIVFVGAFVLRALGLPFGGWLVDHLSWRWLFGVSSLVLGAGALPALLWSKEVWPRHRETKADAPGLLLLTAGLGALTVAAVRGQRDAWFASPAIVALLLVAATALPLFGWHQHRAGNRRRLITFASLRHRGMGVGVALSFLAGLMLVGGVYVLPQFFLRIVGCDAVTTGWLLSIDAIAVVAGLLAAMAVFSRVLTRSTLTFSGLLFTVSMLLLAARITSATPVEAFWLPLALHGFGVGLALPPIGIFSFRAIGAHHAHNAEGRAWHYTARQLGATVAVVVAVWMLDTRATVHSARLAEHVTATNPLVASTVSTLGRGLASHGLPPAVGADAARLVLGHLVARESSVLAFQDLFLLTAVVGVVVSALSFGLPKLRGAALTPVRTR
jgi:DHA2 family multidrug resistance protein